MSSRGAIFNIIECPFCYKHYKNERSRIGSVYTCPRCEVAFYIDKTTNKTQVYPVDFQDLINNPQTWGKFGKECIDAITVDPSETVKLAAVLKATIEGFPPDEKVYIEKRAQGWFEEKIADFLGVSRRTIIRKKQSVMQKLDPIIKNIKNIVTF